MRHERTKLFHDQLRALVDYLGYEYLDANICIKYIGNDEGDNDMHFVRSFPFNCDFPMLIVYWNGIDMYYEEINDDPELFDYEPKKSVKDECLKLIDAIEGNIVDMDNRAAARKELPVNARLLRNMIKTMKDNI